MMPYIDDLGFFHDSKKANSNNKFAYTAYAMRVKFLMALSPVMLGEIQYCFYNRVRHSQKVTVPISRDEMLGISFMCPDLAKQFIKDGFRMAKEMPRFNLFRFMAQLPRFIWHYKQRNYWHKNSLEQMMFFTAKLPLHDRASVYRFAGEKTPFFYGAIEWFDKKRKPSGRSSAAIRSFKYEMDGYKGIADYFEEGHPIKSHIMAPKS